MTHSPVSPEMPESATQPQSDTQSDALTDFEPVTSEALPPQDAPQEPLQAEPPQEALPAEPRWRVSRSAILLIGGPLAGAVLVWLAISIFSSKPTAPPEEPVTEQRAPEPVVEPLPGSLPPIEGQSAAEVEPEVQQQADVEPQPAMEASVPSPAVAEAEPAPAPADPAPRQQANQANVASALNEVTPKVPQSALNTISGTVRVAVRVTVDKGGAVIDATAADPGPSRYFERLSVDASKKWTFAPATSEEQRTMLVKFNFTREGVTAYANAAE